MDQVECCRRALVVICEVDGSGMRVVSKEGTSALIQTAASLQFSQPWKEPLDLLDTTPDELWRRCSDSCPEDTHHDIRIKQQTLVENGLWMPPLSWGKIPHYGIGSKDSRTYRVSGDRWNCSRESGCTDSRGVVDPLRRHLGEWMRNQPRRAAIAETAGRRPNRLIRRSTSRSNNTPPSLDS